MKNTTNKFCIACIIIFFCDCITGFKLTELGQKDNYAILHNFQVYRLFTYSLLHRSLQHITSNLIAIKWASSKIERYHDYTDIQCLFFLLSASAVTGWYSTVFNNYHSAGASGIAFALLGALIMQTHINHDKTDTFIAVSITTTTLLYGLFTAKTDNIAHISGLIYGLLITGNKKAILYVFLSVPLICLLLGSC